jgi:hypothetical protein
VREQPGTDDASEWCACASPTVLVAAAFKALKSGALEIRVGQSNQLYWMSRIAPGFIKGQLWKGSQSLIPPPESSVG